MAVKSRLNEKMREGVAAVLPIALIVMVLCFTITPIPTDLMLAFVIGTVMLIAGMGLFTYGAEASMTPIGNHIGAKLTKSRSLPLILSFSFLLGVIITIAEPDLQVLAGNVPHIDSTVLILTVSVGVGFFFAAKLVERFLRKKLCRFLRKKLDIDLRLWYSNSCQSPPVWWNGRHRRLKISR